MKAFDLTDIQWEPVRPEIARGIVGRTMLNDEVKATMTRVTPGGKFPLHRDKYGHLFYFISGQGTVKVGEENMNARPGLTVQILPGEPHAYENTGTDDLVLISLNLPASKG